MGHFSTSTKSAPSYAFFAKGVFAAICFRSLRRMLERVGPMINPSLVVLDTGSFGEFPLILKKFFKG